MFEDSGDINDVFLFDGPGNHLVHWNELCRDLKNIRIISPTSSEEGLYHYLQSFIITLLIDKPLVLKLKDATSEESSMSLSNDELDQIEEATFDKATLIGKINEKKSNWYVDLFSSGSFGAPKKTRHSFESFLDQVSFRDEHQTAVWGFSYHPMHIAGIQLLIQAIATGGSLIWIRNLSDHRFLDVCKQFQVTHLAGTPTFYRLLLNTDDSWSLPSIRQVTLGGEIVTGQDVQRIRSRFPNARISNVYATSETGTLLKSDGELFSISESNRKKVQIIENEIWVLKRDSNDASSDVETFMPTGDIVKVISVNPLKFVFTHRKGNVAKISGYRVDLEALEAELKRILNISELMLFTKTHQLLGSILLCQIAKRNSDLDEASIRRKLVNRLEEYQIPRQFIFVDSLSQTMSGKIKRSQ